MPGGAFTVGNTAAKQTQFSLPDAQASYDGVIGQFPV
jgi:hypothetical protein